MKNLFKPYGVAFKAGMVLLAGCFIFLLIAYTIPNWYNQYTIIEKSNIASLWRLIILLGLLLITVGLPTTSSKK